MRGHKVGEYVIPQAGPLPTRGLSHQQMLVEYFIPHTGLLLTRGLSHQQRLVEYVIPHKDVSYRRKITIAVFYNSRVADIFVFKVVRGHNSCWAIIEKSYMLLGCYKDVINAVNAYIEVINAVIIQSSLMLLSYRGHKCCYHIEVNE